MRMTHPWNGTWNPGSGCAPDMPFGHTFDHPAMGEACVLAYNNDTLSCNWRPVLGRVYLRKYISYNEL